MINDQYRGTFWTAVLIAITVWIVVIGALWVLPVEITPRIQRAWQAACAMVAGPADLVAAGHEATGDIAETAAAHVGSPKAGLRNAGDAGAASDLRTADDQPNENTEEDPDRPDQPGADPTALPGEQPVVPGAPQDTDPSTQPQPEPRERADPEEKELDRPDDDPEARPLKEVEPGTSESLMPDEPPVPRSRHIPGKCPPAPTHPVN